jgi:hypothetical protein
VWLPTGTLATKGQDSQWSPDKGIDNW